MAIYRAYAPYDNSIAANQQTWATTFGQAALNFGWVAQTGHGEVPASNVSGTWTWANPPAVPSSSIGTPRAIVNFRGAWSSGNSYAPNDTTTNAGQTWIALTTVASGSSAPASGSSWQPYNFEIFASNGPMSATFQIYLKVVYANTNNGLGPALQVMVGTGIDSSGNITGTIPLIGTSPTSIGNYNPQQDSNTNPSFEMDFSGDADNFRFSAWRNGVAQGFNGTAWGPPVLVIDRAKTASGADADGYAYIAFQGMSSFGTGVNGSGILLKSTIGSLGPNMVSGLIGNPTTPSGSLAMWGSSPVLPIIPPVGYAANPLLGMTVVQGNDWADGAIIPVWMYGTVHYFMVCGSSSAFGGYRFSVGSSMSQGTVPAIRWE